MGIENDVAKKERKGGKVKKEERGEDGRMRNRTMKRKGREGKLKKRAEGRMEG